MATLDCDPDTADTGYFVGVVDGGPGAYGISFPDLPGCVSAGDTLQQVARNAEEALQIHVDAMIDEGIPVPEPRARDQIEADPEVCEVTRIEVQKCARRTNGES